MKKTLIIVLCIGFLIVSLRFALEPNENSLPFRQFDAALFHRAQTELPASVISDRDLVPIAKDHRVLLIGEEHFVIEPQRFATELLDQLGDSSIVLLLELSQDGQGVIDSFLHTGDERTLDLLWSNSSNLPYRLILRWAYQKRPIVKRVIAFDENRNRIILNRLMLTDTRNQTMADAILAAYKSYPGARIVAYGGQMHMMMGGRYRFDRENRVPAGSRLVRMGIARSEICSIMLSGRTKFPLDTIWTGRGAIVSGGRMGQYPYEYFINYPVFGIRQAGELFDVFVNLGALTEVADRQI